MDLKYKEKLAKLQQREQEVIERVTEKMKEVESFNHQQRQKILKDLEMIRLKEKDLASLEDALSRREEAMNRSK